METMMGVTIFLVLNIYVYPLLTGSNCPWEEAISEELTVILFLVRPTVLSAIDPIYCTIIVTFTAHLPPPSFFTIVISILLLLPLFYFFMTFLLCVP